MKTTIFLGSLFIFPLIGLALVARSAWVKVLAFLAGIGMSSACNAGDSKPGAESNDPKPLAMAGDSQPEVECYKQVAVTPAIMQDPRWAHSNLIADWAIAERAVLICASSDDVRTDELQQKIIAARQAATDAKPIVAVGLLSKPAYDLAVKILNEWHTDTAMSYSGAKCYKRMAPPPAVSDTKSRLKSLSKLQKQGKLSDEVVNQARESMKSSLTASLSAKQSAELADFLLDLLGFAQ